jgi:hypothetical protein
MCAVPSNATEGNVTNLTLTPAYADLRHSIDELGKIILAIKDENCRLRSALKDFSKIIVKQKANPTLQRVLATNGDVALAVAELHLLWDTFEQSVLNALAEASK